MVFKKFLKALGRVFGFKKRKKRRPSIAKRHARRRPVSRRRIRFSHRKISSRKKKRVVRHKARRKARKLRRRPRRPAPKAPRPAKAKNKAAKTPWVPAGEITHYFPKVKAAVFKCRVPLAIGDAIWVKGKNTDFRQTVGSMQIDREPIERAAKGQEIGLEVFKDVHEGDQVFLTRL